MAATASGWPLWNWRACRGRRARRRRLFPCRRWPWSTCGRQRKHGCCCPTHHPPCRCRREDATARALIVLMGYTGATSIYGCVCDLLHTYRRFATDTTRHAYCTSIHVHYFERACPALYHTATPLVISCRFACETIPFHHDSFLLCRALPPPLAATRLCSSPS